jgi:hypothetical protein
MSFALSKVGIDEDTFVEELAGVVFRDVDPARQSSRS